MKVKTIIHRIKIGDTPIVTGAVIQPKKSKPKSKTVFINHDEIKNCMVEEAKRIINEKAKSSDS